MYKAVYSQATGRLLLSACARVTIMSHAPTAEVCNHSALGVYAFDNKRLFLLYFPIVIKLPVIRLKSMQSSLLTPGIVLQ